MGFNLVRGVLFYGDPNTLMLRGRDVEWTALRHAPPVLGASADTLYALDNPNAEDARFVVARYLRRAEE